MTFPVFLRGAHIHKDGSLGIAVIYETFVDVRLFPLGFLYHCPYIRSRPELQELPPFVKGSERDAHCL
jgi:hypothetical protein